MKFNFAVKKDKEHNYLELTPVRKHKHEPRDDGGINVLIPKFTSKFSEKYIQKHLRFPYIRANLDEFGSQTWLLIDGITNVELIGKELQEKYGEKIEPVYERLTKFLTEMNKYGFIYFKELKSKF